jgi:hypothetical protein
MIEAAEHWNSYCGGVMGCAMDWRVFVQSSTPAFGRPALDETWGVASYFSVAGETDPIRLAELADRRIKAARDQLVEALLGRVTDYHRFMLQLHREQVDAGQASYRSLI